MLHTDEITAVKNSTRNNWPIRAHDTKFYAQDRSRRRKTTRTCL